MRTPDPLLLWQWAFASELLIRQGLKIAEEFRFTSVVLCESSAGWQRTLFCKTDSRLSKCSHKPKSGFAEGFPAGTLPYDFGWIVLATEHVQQILSNMATYLIELHRENEEWEEIQNSF
jgi:hypothetical protein